MPHAVRAAFAPLPAPPSSPSPLLQSGDEEYWSHMMRRHNGTLPTCLASQRKHGWARWTRERPQYVVFGGVEGAGHHVATAIFKQGTNQTSDTRSAWLEVEQVSQFVTREGVPDIVSPEALWARVCSAPTFAPGCKGSAPTRRIVNVAGSHPFGHPRSANRFIDLLAIDELDSRLHKLDVRHLFLVRDPSAVILADSIHRQFASVTKQSRILELDVAYLEVAFRALPCGRSLLLPYELAVTRPAVAGLMLARLFDASPDDQRVLVRAALRAIAPPAPRPDDAALPQEIQEFWSSRRRQYPAILGEMRI